MQRQRNVVNSVGDKMLCTVISLYVQYSIAVFSAAGCSAEIDAKFSEESNSGSCICRQHQAL